MMKTVGMFGKVQRAGRWEAGTSKNMRKITSRAGGLKGGAEHPSFRVGNARIPGRKPYSYKDSPLLGVPVL